VLLLTTSRRPTPRTRTFCRGLARSIPNVVRINRGKLSLDGIVEKSLELNANHVIIVDRWKGGPGKIEFFKIEQEGLVPVPPIMYVSSIKLQREFDRAKIKPVRSLIITMSSENSNEIIRIARSLSNFLNVPLSQRNKAVSKSKTSMHISTDDLYRTQVTFMLFLPENVEIGPRITLSHVAWEIKK
jgi:U3 small nucleolar ribonucleoprotein protein IMP4